MAEWTPEAAEYLDGYLKQVRALARGAGEDGEEIASGLREHVEARTVEDVGPLVTLDLLIATLGRVGSPQEVVAEGVNAKDSKLSTFPEVPLGVHVERRTSIFAILAKTAALVCLVALGIGATSAYYEICYSDWLVQRRSHEELMRRGHYGTPEYKESRRLREVHMAMESTNKMKAVLRDICDAEERFLSEGKYDADGDGKSDYGTIRQLRDAGIYDKTTEELEEYSKPYVINVSLTWSSDPNGPSFACDAITIPQDASYPPLHMEVGHSAAGLTKRFLPLRERETEAR